MSQAAPDLVPLTMYLLGRTDERESRAIEDRYFEDEEYFAQLEVAVDDLADAYVRKQLSVEDCARFERFCFHSRDDRVRVRIADALKRSKGAAAAFRSDAPREGKSLATPARWAILSRGALATAAMVVIAVLGVRVAQLQRALSQAESQLSAVELASRTDVSAAATAAAAERARREELEAQVQGLATVSLALVPGAPRAAESIPTLQLGSRISFVRFTLALEDDPPSAQVIATVRTPSRAIVWRQPLPPDSVVDGVITMTVPAAIFDRGEYELVLSDTGNSTLTDLARYVFVIAPRERTPEP